jgi:hypothetical protein
MKFIFLIVIHNNYQSIPFQIQILICADSWMPEKFNPNRRFLLIIIALNIGEWNIPCPGYDIHVDTPKDVKNKHLSLFEAWFHYAINRGFEVLTKRMIFKLKVKV